MTPRQISLARSSYEKLQPVADQAGQLFFERLFRVDPSLQMMGAPAEERGTRLVRVLGLVITVLQHLDSLTPALEAMGSRQVIYGVKEQHYETIGACLLWTMEQQLQAGFTPEMREAWMAACVTLAGRMKRGAMRNAA